jgi:hypothetical protein
VTTQTKDKMLEPNKTELEKEVLSKIHLGPELTETDK